MNKPKSTKLKSIVIFNDTKWQSPYILTHCLRIPDVMNRIVMAQQILSKYKIKPPAWIFGLIDKWEKFNSPMDLQMMSFLVNIGLYDRLVRTTGTSQFLTGPSASVLVASHIITFEKMLINIFCKIKILKKPLVLYKKNTKIHTPFSLCPIVKAPTQTATLQKVINTYNIKRCMFIFPQNHKLNSPKHIIKSNFIVQNMIHTDPKLSWFWPILKKHKQIKTSMIPDKFSLNTHFH